MMVEHALRYAARGWCVFPVQGKKPAIVRWPQLASSDPARIRKWWSKWPEANIGLAIERSGLVVLDVDPRNGGDKSFDRLVGVVGRLILDGPTVLTGGGGFHVYFERPTDPDAVRILRDYVKNRIDIIDPDVCALRVESSKARNRPHERAVELGIDVPAYVVAPPSLHASGEPYRWEIGDEDAVPSPLPAGLVFLSIAPIVTLHPSSVFGGLGAGDRTLETLRPLIRANISAAKKSAKNREMLERYARRFAQPGTNFEPPAEDGGTQLAPWASDWAATPGTWAGHYTAIRDKTLAAARAHYHAHGDGGEATFRAALAQKATISPDLRKPSPTSKDRRFPLVWQPFGKRAWDRAVAEPTTDEPIDLDAMAARIPESERVAFDRGAAAYSALLLMARHFGVRAQSFSKDYAALGHVLGVSKMSARRYVLDAEDFGLIQILDAGKPRAKGQRGTPTTFFIATAKMVASVERVEPMVERTSKRRSPKPMDREPLRLAG